MDQVSQLLSSISLTKLLPAVLVLGAGIVAIKLLGKLFDKGLEHSKLESNIRKAIRRVFRILLYAVLALIVFGTLGFDVSSLVAIFSVISLAISLAIQGTLANIAGGIQILTSHPFHIGDFVEIGSTSGTVQAIHLAYTVLVTIDNKDVFVPNSDVAGSRIVNHTAEGTRRLDLTFGISYDCDVETAKQALLQVAEGENILQEPAPFVGLMNYGDSAVEYVLRVWCKTEDYWDLYFSMQAKAKKILESYHAEITYPHLTVHLDSQKP